MLVLRVVADLDGPIADYGGEEDGDDSDDEGEELPFDDVEADFMDDANGKWNLKNVSTTRGYVKRRYAFGIKGVPRKETDWLEVSCDFPGAFPRSMTPLSSISALTRPRPS